MVIRIVWHVLMNYPWDDFTALENLLKDRTDWDSDVYPISILREKCKENEKEPCKLQQKLNFSALDVQSGEILSTFSKIWREKNDSEMLL